MKKAIAFLFVIFFTITSFSCIINTAGKPYMVDRTVNWEASLPCNTAFSIDQFTREDFFLYSFVFRGSRITKDSAIILDPNDSPEKILETALKHAFGEQFIDIGSNEVFVAHSGTKAFITGGETFAMFYRYSGELAQCIDTRIQIQFQGTTYQDFKSGFIRFETDIAKLTSKEIKEFAKVAIGYDDQYDPTEISVLPVTAEEAYNITANGLYAHHANKAGSARLGGIGGAFYIYDLKMSDSWAVVGNVFLQVIDKETGERLLLVQYHTKDDQSFARQGDGNQSTESPTV